MICLKNYKPHYNATVEMTSLEKVSASNTRNVLECGRVCSEYDDCRGFTYHNDESGTCEIYYKGHKAVPAAGIDYYERNCYKDSKLL